MTGSRTRVKVCGLTRACDARAAVRAGADALGVILAPGHHRSLTLDQAAAVLAGVPADVARVGVFVDPSLAEVEAAVTCLGLSEVQLHGAESPEFCASVRVPVVKTFRVGPGFNPAAIGAYRDVAAAVLLDTLVDGVAGGSGREFDRSLALGIPRVPPVYLAGGLDADNVGAAVRALRPAGVDVSSGVEAEPGVKDASSMRRFVAAVRAADEDERGDKTP